MNGLKKLEITIYCEKGGMQKAKCDGKCVKNGVVCVHLMLLEVKETSRKVSGNYLLAKNKITFGRREKAHESVF